MQLYAASRSLPGERRDLCRVVYNPTVVARSADSSIDPRVRLLRRRTAELLRVLAANAEKTLRRAVDDASGRWDQVDAVNIITPMSRMDRRDLQTDWRALIVEVPEAAIEALATIDAAFDLSRLLERHLATFVRLRLRQGAPLVVDGRPFLDAAAAFSETAEAYS